MSDAGPDVTVLLTTRNRAALLRQTLAALRRVETSHLVWELIIVDNGSTDGTKDVLDRAADTLPLTRLTEPTAGKSHALNQAFRIVRAPLVLLTDDDVEPSVTWLTAHVDAARRWPEHDVFGGPVIPAFPPGTPDWLKTHACTAPAFAHFAPDVEEGPMDRLPFGPNVAYRREALREVRLSGDVGPRGTSYPMGSDSELARKVLGTSRKAVFVPNASVRHIVRPEQVRHRWLMRRAFNMGRGAPRQGQLFPDVLRLLAPSEVRQRILRAAWRYAAALPHGPQRRLEYGAEFHYWRGYRYEQRRLARETIGLAAAERPEA